MKLFKKLTIFSFFLVLVSCSKRGSTTTTSTTQSNAKETVPSGTMKIIATNESYKELFDKFTAETGIKCELLSMSSGEALSKIRAEGKSTADLWFGGGVDSFMAAKTDGLLEKVDFPESSQLNSKYKDSDNYWFAKGLTIVGFLLNDDIMKEKKLPAPKTWDDLIKPEYKGEIIMSNPAISGTNYAALMGILQTKADGWKYFEVLNNNIAYYSRRGSDPKNKVIGNEFAIGITYIDGTIEDLLNDYNVTIVYPSDGIPYMPDGVAVFAKSDNTEAAKYFVKWLFSNDENLLDLARIDKKTSIKVIKPSLKGIELDYSTDILMNEDISAFGRERETVLERFQSIASGKTT